MAGPRDFLKRAENNRRMEIGQKPQSPQPAPMPIRQAAKPDVSHDAAEPIQESLPVPPPMEYRIAPRPIGGHSIYRNLMRSHDRMGTRHIKKN